MSKIAVIVLTAALAASLVACGGGDDTPLPTFVDQIVENRCRLCHGEETAFGAPMSLVSWEDTQKPAPTDSAHKVWEEMQLRIHDTSEPMPPRGSPALSITDFALLDAWFAEGAPPAPEED